MIEHLGRTAKALGATELLDQGLVYNVMMGAWEIDQHALYEAFGSVDALANALRQVAPPLTQINAMDRPRTTSGKIASGVVDLSFSGS